jgi:hypothetical protein
MPKSSVIPRPTPRLGPGLAVGDDTNRIIQAINEGGSLDELLEETAAGEAAGGSDGGSTFVRLLRIAESVDPLGYEYEGACGE